MAGGGAGCGSHVETLEPGHVHGETVPRGETVPNHCGAPSARGGTLEPGHPRRTQECEWWVILRGHQSSLE